MSETSFALGEGAAAGFKINAAEWNTSNTGVVMGTNDRVEITGVDLKPKVTWADNDALPGAVAIRRAGVIAQYDYVGKLTGNLPYHGIGRFMASLWGSETTTEYGVAGAAYNHLFIPAADSPYYAAFAYGNLMECHDFAFLHVFGGTFTYATNAIPKVEWDVIAKKELTDGSGSNTLVTLGNLSHLATQPATRFPMLHAAPTTIRMNTSSGIALATGDKRYPSQVVISVKRTMGPLMSLQNAPFTDQPHNNGWLDIMVTLTFPNYKTASDWTAALAGNLNKLDMTSIGDVIGSSETFQHIWELPLLEIDANGLPNISKPGLLGYTIPLRARVPYAAVAGMSSLYPSFSLRDSISGNHYANAIS